MCVDSSGPQQAVYQMLRDMARQRGLGCIIEPRYFDPMNKHKMTVSLKRAIKNKEISYYTKEKCPEEMKSDWFRFKQEMVELEVAYKDYMMSASAPDKRGSHDDYFASACLVWDCYTTFSGTKRGLIRGFTKMASHSAPPMRDIGGATRPRFVFSRRRRSMSKKSWIDRLLGRESADELIERAKAETRLEVAASMKKYRLFRAVDQKRTVKGEHVGSSVKRVAFSKLEKIYASDPVIFNGCNTLSYLVNRGWSVQGPDDAVEKELAAWLKGLKIDEAIRQIALQLCVYGNSWIENVMNKNRNRVVDIVILDPKTMDYIRETSQYSPDCSNRIKVDSSGKPVGYVQRLSGALAFRSGEKDVFFTLDEVTHLTMRKLADGFVGIGVIEPCYDESVIKVNVEEALGQAIYHIGFPVYKLRIGDKDAMPDVSDEIIDYYEKELADASSKMDFIIPWFADLTILSAPEIRDMRTNLDYYIDSQIPSIGGAKPFVLGSAEGANRATREFLTEIRSEGRRGG